MNNYPIFAHRPGIKNTKTDNGFIISIILLLGLGLVTLFISASGTALRIKNDSMHFILRQLRYCIVGFLVMLVVYFVKTSFIIKILPIIVFGSMFICLLTYIPGLGITLKGARRWIHFPIVGRLQPSELVKPAVVLFLANFFSKDREGGTPQLFKAAIIICVFVIIIFGQDDFSTAFFIMVLSLIMFFIAGIKLRWFVSFCLVALPVAFLFIFTEKYRVYRLIAFFNRDYDLHGLNYQVNMAKKAIASGGFWGKGINTSLRSATTIPEIQADFIFAGWAESMGFFGVLCYFALLIYFALKGYKSALNCVDKFNGLTCFGLVTCIVYQSIINCGVVCGALPSTGIPLPFFSSGGSSLIITLAMCGLIMNVLKNDRKIQKENYYE